jgi:Ca2+-binding RTX toxin-like protein
MGEQASVPDEIICVLYDHENDPVTAEPDETTGGVPDPLEPDDGEGATSAGTTATPGETAGLEGGAPLPDGVYFVNTIRWGGTDGDDVYEGGSRTNVYFGDRGDDRISGLAGDDGLLGGAGRDTIEGGAGHDFLGGNGGDDEIHGGADRDFVWGGSGDDVLAAARETTSCSAAWVTTG